MLPREEMQIVRSRSLSDLSTASNLIMKRNTPHMSRRRGCKTSRSWNRGIRQCRVRIPRIRGTIDPSNNHQDINSPGKNDSKKENFNI